MTTADGGCGVSVIYGVLAFVALILVLCQRLTEKKKLTKLLCLYVCVFLANSGYFLLSVAPGLAVGADGQPPVLSGGGLFGAADAAYYSGRVPH